MFPRNFPRHRPPSFFSQQLSRREGCREELLGRVLRVHRLGKGLSFVHLEVGAARWMGRSWEYHVFPMFFLIWVACGCLCFRDFLAQNCIKLLFFDIIYIYIFCGIEWGDIWDMHITKGIHQLNQGLATEMEVSPARHGDFANQNGKLGRGDGRRITLLTGTIVINNQISRVAIASSIYSHHCIHNFHGASQHVWTTISPQEKAKFGHYYRLPPTLTGHLQFSISITFYDYITIYIDILRCITILHGIVAIL